MRILVFGDSITQGFHDEVAGGWCDRLKADVLKNSIEKEEYRRSVINLGVSGDNTDDLLVRIGPETEARVLKYPGEDDVVLLAIGVNDSQYEMVTNTPRVSIGQMKKNLEGMYKVTHRLVSSVVVMGIAPVFDERIQPMAWRPTHAYSNEMIAKYNNALKDFADENKLIFIDMVDVYGDDAESCLPDGIHPNAKGYKLIFERVKNELEKQGIL